MISGMLFQELKNFKNLNKYMKVDDSFERDMNRHNGDFMRFAMMLMLLLAPVIGVPIWARGGKEVPLKDAFAGKFKIGMAMTQNQLLGKDPEGLAILLRNCDVVIPENAFKSGVLQPVGSGVDWNWAYADTCMAIAERNGLELVGHSLMWHPHVQLRWKPKGDGTFEGTREEFKAWMKDYITTVVTRYRGKVKVWDVVNEAIMEDGTYRNSPMYYFLGEEWIPLAFEYAHAADPDAKLYINDYAMWEPKKRETYKRIVKDLRRRGIPIYGIGLQSHFIIDHALWGHTPERFDEAIKDLATTGCKILITEFDLSALPVIWGRELPGGATPDAAAVKAKTNPYPRRLPPDVTLRWNSLMDGFMQVMLDNADVIDRVSTWGVRDQDSWRNSYPAAVGPRTDYPLWYDRQGNLKAPIVKIVERLAREHRRK